MALYLGNEKIQLHIGDMMCILNLYSSTLIINGIKLLSSENYVLKDVNGLYLTAKEDE